MLKSRRQVLSIWLFSISLIFFIGVGVRPVFAQTQQQIALRTGFNFVSFTVVPSQTIAEFKTQNPAIADIYLYSPAAGGFLSYGDSTLASIGIGKGYIILASANATVTVDGTAPGVVGDIKLKQGFNLVGFSKNPESALKFSDLIKRSSSLKGIYNWNGVIGSFITVAVNSVTGAIEQLDGTDPSFAPGKSYFMYLSSDETLNYDGAAITITGGSAPQAVAAPVMTPAGGTFTAAQTVSITCATAGALIKYTLDGADPIVGGLVYTSEIVITSTTTIKAAATKEGMTASAVVTAVYTINPVTPADSALTDIAVSGFSKKALLAVNVNGVAEGAETEAVGVLPASVNGPAKMVMNFGPVTAGMRDRHCANRAPVRQTGTRTRPVVTENDQKYTFKVNADDNTSRNLVASKVYGSSSSKCLIFLDDAVTTAHDWDAVGKNFDNVVYQKMVNAFGEPTDIDANGKIVILYYDMGAKESNTYGYFLSTDLTLDGGGNEMEVFYMNIKFQIETGSTATANPLDPEMIRTLSHEFEHLINYGQRVMIKKINRMDSWMDEGMAESAEQLVGGTSGTGRINTFKSDADNKIRNGAPLCVWMNDDVSYALAYTFMQYCKNHAKDGEAMFKQLIAENNGDFRGLETVMKAQNPTFADFASLVIGYRVANMVNAPSGIYGYGAENSIFNFSESAFAPTSVSGVKLAPGGCVYIYPSDSDLSSFKPNGQGANIRFVRVNK